MGGSEQNGPCITEFMTVVTLLCWAKLSHLVQPGSLNREAPAALAGVVSNVPVLLLPTLWLRRIFLPLYPVLIAIIR